MGSRFYKGGWSKTRDKAVMKTQIEWLVPRVYAAVACEPWDRGWSSEEIQDLFNGTQERWQDSVENGWDMLKNVEEVTGIKVEYFTGKGTLR